MSNFKTCFTTVKAINPHPNPEVHSLEIATVYEYNIVIRKDTMKVGDIVYYLPIDSILFEPSFEELVAPATGKVKLSNSRIKQIRLQKYPSQGMLVNAEAVLKYMKEFCKLRETVTVLSLLEEDTSGIVNVKKYEPPAPSYQAGLPITSKKRLAEHPSFHQYKGITNIKWGDPFKVDENVSVQLKMHGSNVRAAILPKRPKNIVELVLKLFKLLPKYEFRYGSNNVDITLKSDKNSGFYGTDIYGSALKAGKIESKVKPNELLFGEVVGEGIQKGYHYGHKKPHFILFDVKVFKDDNDTKGKWLNPEEVEAFAKERSIPMVPTLYKGLYERSIVESKISGKDDYYPQHTKEGVVVKSIDNYNDPMSEMGKKVRKYINPEYLDKDQSDFH